MTRPLLLLLLPLLAASARAQDVAPVASGPVALEYRFDRLAGKTAVYSIENDQRVAQEIKDEGGGEVRSWVRQTLEQRYEAGERGLGVVHVTTKRLEARLEQQGATITYDSDKGGKAPGAFTALAKKVGVTVTLEVNRRGVVEKVRGVPPAERSAWKTSFLELPERPLEVGRGWERLDRQPMEPLGTLVYMFRYTLGAIVPAAGDAPVTRRIDATIRATLDDVLPSQRTAVELTSQSGEGRLVLDEDGLVRESLLESRLELTVKAAAGTQIQRIKNRTAQVLVELRRS